VTDQTLALRERAGLQALSRREIERVAVRTPTGSTRAPRIIADAAIGAAAALPFVLLFAAHDEQGTQHGAEIAAVAIGTGAGAILGAQGPCPVEIPRTDRLHPPVNGNARYAS
jgi:hypothetical protein